MKFIFSFFNRSKVTPLEKKLGYVFKDKQVLTTALTHPSYRQINVSIEDFERLEYLGDAVIYLLLAEELYSSFPKEDEGILARYRSILGKGTFLAGLARKIELQDCLRLSDAAWREKNNILNDNNLADAFEAVIGAVFVDGGMNRAKRVFFELVGDMHAHLEVLIKQDNPKGRLQELIQAKTGKNSGIYYELLEATGPEHKKQFTVGLNINNEQVATGQGSNRKQAEEAAAARALEILNSR